MPHQQAIGTNGRKPAVLRRAAFGRGGMTAILGFRTRRQTKTGPLSYLSALSGELAYRGKSFPKIGFENLNSICCRPTKAKRSALSQLPLLATRASRSTESMMSRPSAPATRICDSLVTDTSTTAFLAHVGRLTAGLVLGKGRGGRHSPARARTIVRTGFPGIRPTSLWP